MDLGTHPTAEVIKAMPGLSPTCGFVAETYRSPLKIPTNALPQAYEGERPYGSSLYFLVTPEAQIVLHRIRSGQLCHHHLGASPEVSLLYPDGNGEVVSVAATLGRANDRSCLYREVPSTLAAGAGGRVCSAGEHGVARGGTS